LFIEVIYLSYLSKLFIEVIYRSYLSKSSTSWHRSWAGCKPYQMAGYQSRQFTRLEVSPARWALYWIL